MAEIIGADLRGFTTPGSLGVVVDTRYVRCFWPRLDEPVALFANGSTGIAVQGPPTPRNVIFPEDTVALPVLVGDGDIRNLTFRESDVLTKLDCFFRLTRATRDVMEDELIKRTIEVEPTVHREVEYSRPKTVRKVVDVITDVDPTTVRRVR